MIDFGQLFIGYHWSLFAISMNPIMYPDDHQFELLKIVSAVIARCVCRYMEVDVKLS